MPGDRFSQIYLERGAAERDSGRLRRRLTEKFSAMAGDISSETAFGENVVAETGAELVKSGNYYFVASSLPKLPLRDLLDVITLFYDWLLTTQRSTRRYGTGASMEDS